MSIAAQQRKVGITKMSLTKEDLKAIADLIDIKLEPINNRLDNIEERLDTIEENTEITRGATNEILTWLDTYWRKDMDRPFPANEKDVG